MPREFTHWTAAERVAVRLKNTIYEEPIGRYKNLFLLGSNFHDSLFYATKISSKSEIGKIANILHGSNQEDTFDIVKSLVDEIIKKDTPEYLLAFLVGIITHIFMDSSFHPLVFYFAGHYSKKNKRLRKSNQYHHKLEALIEFYFAKDKIEGAKYRMKKMLKDNLSYIEQISSKLAGNFNKNPRNFSAAVISGYKKLAGIQNLGMNKCFNVISDKIYFLLPNKMKDFISIRYDENLLSQIEKISGDLIYKNPVTGEEIKTSLNIILDKAVEKSVEFCGNIEKFIINKKPLILTYRGASLKSGLINSRVEEMKYFSDFPLVI